MEQFTFDEASISLRARIIWSIAIARVSASLKCEETFIGQISCFHFTRRISPKSLPGYNDNSILCESFKGIEWRLLILTCFASDRSQLHQIKVCCTLASSGERSSTDAANSTNRIINFSLCRDAWHSINRLRSLIPYECRTSKFPTPNLRRHTQN